MLKSSSKGAIAIAIAIVIATVLIVPPVGLAASSDASSTQSFNKAVKEALNHRVAGRHEQALDALGRALAAIRDRSGPSIDVGRSRARYFQALSLTALERYQEARGLLALLGDAPGLSVKERQVVARKLLEVDAAVRAAAAKRPAQVRIVALDHKGKGLKAQAQVDGVAQGPTPLVLKLPPGEHVVVVAGAGIATTEQTFELAPGSSVRLVLRVRRRVVTVVEVAGFDPPPAAWAVAAGGLALVGVAIGLTVAALDDDAEAKLPEATRTGAIRLAAAAQTKAKVAYGLYGLGGALLTAGVAWLFLEGWPEGGPKPSIAVTSTHLQANVRWSF